VEALATGWGFAVEEARNGAEVVEKARRRPPDLILMAFLAERCASDDAHGHEQT
jgi:CheY-like chemotaxis protein